MGNATSRMDLLWDRFEAARSFVPYLPPESDGSVGYPPPPWYRKTAPYQMVVLSQPVNEPYRKWHNDTGYWLNAAFVVSLCALLQDFGIRKVDRNVEGWECVFLLDQLRNVFAHEDGEYDPSRNHHKKIESRLSRLFGETRQPTTPSDQFPLSINSALRPLFEGCRAYVTKVVGDS